MPQLVVSHPFLSDNPDDDDGSDDIIIWLHLPSLHSFTTE
jgi:hypothetical protein